MIVLDENYNKVNDNGQREISSELFTDPPPLYPATSDPSTSQNKPLPRIPPPPQITSSNYLDIVRSEVPIKGSWNVDTSQTQMSRNNSESKSENLALSKPNLRLLTQQGGIDAVVKLKGGRRALIEATCYDGPVTLKIVRIVFQTCQRVRALFLQRRMTVRKHHFVHGSLLSREMFWFCYLVLSTGLSSVDLARLTI
jgi:hypothetical protein